MINTDVRDLNTNDYMVIDLDSGTVIGTNIVLVKVSDVTAEQIEAANESDSAAHDLGTEHGRAVYMLSELCPECGRSDDCKCEHGIV